MIQADRVVGKLRKKSGEDVVVRIRHFGHGRRVDCRVFKLAGDRITHTSEGFSIGETSLDDLIRLLQRTKQILSGSGT